MNKLAILGGGNLGRALALGWVGAGHLEASDIHLTRRQEEKLADLAELGYRTGSDNRAAVRESDLIIVAVQPQQLDALLAEIAGDLEADRHRLVSVVSGVSSSQIRAAVGDAVPLVLAMPNTAVAIGESMTCLSAGEASEEALLEAQELFDLVGKTLVIAEEMIGPATALCACGVAFFLRCIRAASQGGIEIGFHPEEALLLAGQTARGAATLTLRENAHPEGEIDRVTTPRGCTIAGLNEMEHRGLSSALIKGLIVSARAAEELYGG
ncbi:MAG: pyrroline-5-carboxylate reductase [Gemmatimonadota bacterium]|jgi:pyrroline-5-carboxylate reductase